jgi:cytoskeletal protein CcmA (bactofilin family)
MARVEKTRAVVEPDEYFDGRIAPTVKAELDRPVRVRADATVDGSVYGESVTVDEDATITGSAMAENDVTIEGGTIEGEVGTPGKVVAEGAHIEGTVTGTKVTLENTVVRGNVVGSEVILENCVVLGLVTSDRSIDVVESLCYSFRSHGETVLDDATIILPQAVLDGPYRFESPVAVAGLGELTLDEAERHPVVTEDDIYEQDDTGYLTLAPRILNLEAVTDRLSALEDGIMATVADTSDADGTEMSVADVLTELDVDMDRYVSR